MVLISIPAYYSHQPGYSNTSQTSIGVYTIKVYPHNITTGYFQKETGEIKFQIDSPVSTNYTLDVFAINPAGAAQTSVFSTTVHGNKYYQFSLDLSSIYIKNRDISLRVVIGNEYTSYIQLTVTRSYLPYALDFMFYSSLVLLFFGAYTAATSNRILLVPVAILYSAVSVVMGQRYDLFFMISSGLRLIHGVDPYIRSVNLPGPLKWAYPPLFPYYSELVGRLIYAFNTSAIPSNQSLNYIGVLYGNLYSAWKGLKEISFYIFYAAIKVPMVISVFGIYALLRKLSPLKNRLFGLWLLNPAVILIGIAWGQIDAVAAFCMLLSIFLFRKGQTGSSVLMASLGAMIKIFPVLLIPFILLSSRHRFRDIMIVAIMLLVTLLLYYTVGNFNENIGTLIYSRTSPTFNGVFFVNGLSWEILIDTLRISNFPSLFLYVFVPVYFLLIAIYWKTGRGLEQFVIISFLIFFLTYNIVNPQYLIYPIVLYLALGKVREVLALSAVAVAYVSMSSTLAFFLNPDISYNYLSSIFGQAQNFLFSSISGKTILYFIIFGTNALFLYLISKELVILKRRSNLEETSSNIPRDVNDL